MEAMTTATQPKNQQIRKLQMIQRAPTENRRYVYSFTYATPNSAESPTYVNIEKVFLDKKEKNLADASSSSNMLAAPCLAAAQYSTVSSMDR
jgi:hypothetical protein